MSDERLTEVVMPSVEWNCRRSTDSVSDVVWTMDLQGQISYISSSVTTETGYLPQEYHGQPLERLLAPKSAARVLDMLDDRLSRPAVRQTEAVMLDLQLRAKAGPPVDVEVSMCWFHDADGKLVGAVAIARNTEAYERSQRELREREELERRCAEEERALNSSRLSALLELNQMSDASLHDLVHFAMEQAVKLTRSSIGYLAFTNEDETVLTMYAWSKTAMMECGIREKPIIYPVASTGLWGEAVRQRRPVITNDYVTANLWKKGLPEGHVPLSRHMNVPVFKGDRIVLVAGVGNKAEDYDEADVRQLTLLMEGVQRILDQRRAEEERKKLQEQLAQASKMEAIGRLAGGIAHDFNNLLTAILGYSEMIQDRPGVPETIRSEIEEIRRAGERAATLTQQLLAFSRKQVIRPRVIDLNAVLQAARGMVEPLIGEYISLVLDLDPDLGHIKADPHQIDQVLLNLTVNGRDAMPDGGTLTIATRNAEFDEQGCPPPPEVAPGPYVVLSVEDTGVGMSAETRAQLFEPFFSTKEGAGAGLGLATVYGIAKQNGGGVSVHSEPGQGATFNIYLPRTSEAPVAAAAPNTTASPTGDETILLVEDNDMVRDLTRRILVRLGYEVLQADDAESAIRICKGHLGRIDLLLSDVIMPLMNGVELYERVREMRPEVKSLFMSGYAENIVARQGVLPEGTRFIQKPFGTGELANRVRRALEG